MGIATINKMPVYIEGHGGNSGASFMLADSVARTLDLLKKHGVYVGWFRSDSGGYLKRVLHLCVQR
jgi:hypothetical protein